MKLCTNIFQQVEIQILFFGNIFLNVFNPWLIESMDALPVDTEDWQT